MSSRSSTTLRQHVYLAADEKDGLNELADRLGASYSFVMRMALRKLLGLPVPAEFRRFPEVEAAAETLRNRARVGAGGGW